MSVTVRITKSFKTAVKPLLKKYPSLASDLLQLEKELSADPKQGTALGHNTYKSGLKFPAREKAKAAAQE